MGQINVTNLQDGDEIIRQQQGCESWNTSYGRGGNICFYPHEEIVRFVNRYVRKKHGINDFEDLLPLLEREDFASLDLGCGIGRHTNFLDEFSLNPYGIDLSDTAISIGKQWLESLGKMDLSERLMVGSVSNLPFDDNFFSICVSCGVLDSMPRKIAIEGMKEIHRVLLPGALMYLDLIMDESAREGDETVSAGYEKDTIHSFSIFISPLHTI